MTEDELDDHIKALQGGIDRAQSERASATAEIARDEAALEDAIYEGSDANADRIERRLKAANRKLQRAEMVLKRLCPRLFEAQQDRQDRKVEPCRQRMIEAFKAVCAAQDALLAANEGEAEVYEASIAELSRPVAEAKIRRGHCQGLAIGPESFDHWRRARELELGLRTMAPAPNSGVPVRFLRAFRQYQVDDVASFSPKEALQLVDKGLVEAGPTAVAGMVELPPDPRKATPPKPDAKGRVQVLIVASFEENTIGREYVGGGFVPGDIASFPLAQAVNYVRSGHAEFVETGLDSDPVSAEVQRGSSADPRVENAGPAELSP